jgi:hypothetical protein
MNRERLLLIFGFGLLLVSNQVNRAIAADQIYVATDSGKIHLLRDIPRGVSSLEMPGSLSVTTRDVDLTTNGIVPDGFSLTALQTTPVSLSNGGQVVLGTTNGYVLTYDANLASLRTATDICDGCGFPVQSVAVGQWGDLPVAVAAAHSLDAPVGTGGFSVPTYNSSMEFIGNTSFVDDGTGPDPDVTALRFGNLDGSRPGNELFIGTTNKNTIHKNSGFLGGVAKDPLATAGNPLPPQFVWDDEDNDVTNGVTTPWYHMNNTIADAFVADSIGFGPPTDEIVVVGQTNDFTGPFGEGPRQFGTMVHQYLAASPAAPIFVFENAGARPDQVSKPILAAVAGNVLDSDPNPTGFDFTGNELIWAGIDELRICNGTTFCTQIINTGERVQHIILADVLHDDGVLEIVLATSNEPFFVSPATDVTGIPFTGGRLLVFEHEVVGDLNTNFVFDPTAADPRGAIVELGATTSVMGMAALLETIPPDGVLGDYNDDGSVDAVDYAVWRNNLGVAITLPNEGATPGIVTIEDYNIWKENYGMTAGSGSLATSYAVPEPQSLLITLLAAVCCGYLRYSR